MVDGLRLAWHQFRLERRMFWRNRTAAFFNAGLPLIFLALFGSVFASDDKALRVIIPGIAGIAIMSTTFNALSMNITILRDQGVLKRVRGTAMPEWSYLTAMLASAIVNAVTQVIIIVVCGRIIFGIGWPPLPLQLVAIAALGVVCMGSLGIAFAHLIPDADSAAAYTNAVFLPLIFISGTFFDAERTPSFLRDIAQALPLSHIVEGLSGTMVTGTPLSDLGSGLAIIGVWTLVASVVAVRGFSWESRRT